MKEFRVADPGRQEAGASFALAPFDEAEQNNYAQIPHYPFPHTNV